MPRHKPFSGKQKKQQLKDKRAQKRGGDNGDDGVGAATGAASRIPASALTDSLGISGTHNKWSTKFAREDNAAVEERRIRAAKPLDLRHRGKPFVARPQVILDPVLEHPKGVVLRSGHSSFASSKQLATYLADARESEEASFKQWLEAIYARYTREQLSNFEHSLEVWMQLWHTLATSDVLCLVADVRNPTWHIPVSLYAQVTSELRKPLMVVLNKTDLVSQAHVEAWLAYLKAAFPAVAAFVPFSASASVLPPSATGISARRRAIKDARACFDGDHVARRAGCVRRLLEAAGAHSDDIAAVVTKIEATKRTRSSGTGGGSMARDERVDAAAELAAAMRQQKLAKARRKGRGRGRRHSADGGSERYDDSDSDADAGSASSLEEHNSNDSSGSGRDEQEDEGSDEEAGGTGSADDSNDGSDDDSEGSDCEDDAAPKPSKLAAAAGRKGVSFAALALDSSSEGDDGNDGDGAEEEAAAAVTVNNRGSKAVGAGRALLKEEDDAEDSDGPVISEKMIRRRERKAKKAQKAAQPPQKQPAQQKQPAGAMPEPSSSSASSSFPTSAAALTIGMIGHPNVGKSSVINTLAGEKRVSVSRTAGHTKRAQTIPLVPGRLHLLDCPGLVFPHALVPPPEGVSLPPAFPTRQAAAAAFGDPDEERGMQELCGVIPLAQVREPYSAVRVLAERLPLERLYGLTLPKDDEEEAWSPLLLCEQLAVKRGYHIARTGRPDGHAAGREILYDTQDGNVPVAWLPPGS